MKQKLKQIRGWMPKEPSIAYAHKPQTAGDEDPSGLWLLDSGAVLRLKPYVLKA